MFTLNSLAIVQKITVTVILLCEVTQEKSFNNVQGPWDMDTDRYEYCPPEVAGLNAVRFEPPVLRSGLNGNRNYFTGNLVIGYPINNNIKAEFLISDRSSRGGWNKQSWKFAADRVCTQLKQWMPRFYSRIFNSSDDFQQKDCPIRVGTYKINHFEIYLEGTDFKLVPVLPYKKYRVDMVFSLLKNTSAVVGCMRIYYTIHPR